MYVKLVAKTEPLIENLKSTSDFIAYVARVSNPTNQMNTKTAPRLLKYLMEHKHWSPFEMAHAVLEIQTTRDIARQILRHRSFSFQEFSQRYADPTQMDFVYSEARLQDTKNRQNSIETEDKELQKAWEYFQREVEKLSIRVYNWGIENGMAKEVSRKVLPEGMTPSTIYMSGSIRSWIHYIELRSGPETQKEHREIAVECGKIIGELIDYEF